MPPKRRKWSSSWAGPPRSPVHQSHLGKDLENGTRLAIDEANAKGVTMGGKKVKFELVGEDDQADPRTGTTVAQRLVDAGVKGVIGHLNSGTTIPASRIYDQAGIPQVSPGSTNPKLTLQSFTGVFRTIANDVQQGTGLGKYATGPLGAKRVAIIDDRTAYGQRLADETAKAVKDLAFFLGDSATTPAWGATAGFLAGFGWATLSFVIIALFEQRSWRYMFINGGFITVYFTLIGFILGIWR